MAFIALHNLCIEISDPCQPRWRLEVNDLDLIQKRLHLAEDKREFKLFESFQLAMDAPLTQFCNKLFSLFLIS